MIVWDKWWERLLAFLIDWWSGRQKQLGRQEIAAEQRAEAEKLKEEYHEIGSDGRSLDDALDRLRARASGAHAGPGNLPKS